MKNIINIFLELVQIDSPSEEEQDMTLYVRKWLEKIGLSFDVDSAGAIVAKQLGVGPSTLFCVHMDTVNPGKGIKPKIKDGVITSSGNTILGADNKAAVAALMIAVEEYQASEGEKKAFELLFSIGEESGNGLGAFPFESIKSKQGFVFDAVSPIGTIVLRSPSICSFKALYSGTASHSSVPEQGKNALIPALQALSRIAIGKQDGGETMINIGLIHGGTGVNTVPNQVAIEGEIRSYEKNLFDSHIKKIKTIFGDAKLTLSGFAPGYSHGETSPLINKIKNIHTKLNIVSICDSYSAVSDANILNMKGIETINIGDGVYNAHTNVEYIKKNDLLQLKDIILNLLNN